MSPAFLTSHYLIMLPLLSENQIADETDCVVARRVLYPGGELPYEKLWDTRRKIRIKPLQENNLGVAGTLFDPYKK